MYLLTHSLTPWSRVLRENLTSSQLVKFPAFYGTHSFITTFTKAHCLSLSSARSIQFMPHPTHFLKIHLPIYRWIFQVVTFPQIPPPKPLYTPPLSLICATCPAHLIILNVITRIIFDENYRSLCMYVLNGSLIK